MKVLSSVALLASLVLGCSGDDPRIRVRVTPQGSEFQLVTTPSRASATIPYTLHNDGDRTILIGGCGATAERLVNGQWEQDHTTICALANSSLVQVPPGDSLNAQTWAEHAGTFRLRASFTVDASESAARSVVSGTFEVK